MSFLSGCSNDLKIILHFKNGMSSFCEEMIRMFASLKSAFGHASPSLRAVNSLQGFNLLRIKEKQP